jgi:hypothetical protein
MACDLEALIYLYPASLAAPMGEQWTRIYLYLGTVPLSQRTSNVRLLASMIWLNSEI